MHFVPSALRGPAFMLLATGAFVVNDTMMKLATEGLPPLQVLFMRGVAATLWCVPLVLVTGYSRELPRIFDRWVLLRNFLELCAVLLFVVALANMPIADVTALGQVTPLLFLIGMAILFREKIGAVRIGLICLGFAGALMVARPTGSGLSVYATLALSSALFCAARDIAGRRVSAAVPGMIVAVCAILMVMTGAGLSHLVFETWVAPQAHHLWLLAGAGFFLIFGHFFIFMSYRVGSAAAVAPFYYGFSVWAVVSQLVVFRQPPDPLALAGIALIVGSGLVIVWLDEQRRRNALAPVA